jgi:hypothetical protein
VRQTTRNRAGPRKIAAVARTGSVSNQNYRRGAEKPLGSEVRVNEYHGLDPNDLPRPGDWVVRKTVAHELIEVFPSKTRPDTVRYRAIRRALTDVPPGARQFSAVSNLRLQGY